jgi:Glyoxalase/Bleomycin resistance protein/Dioxygenase superfamily
MDVKVQNSFLKVDDPDKAIAFYRDALGFEVRDDVGYEGMRWVTVGPPSQPDVTSSLRSPIPAPRPRTGKPSATCLPWGCWVGLCSRPRISSARSSTSRPPARMSSRSQWTRTGASATLPFAIRPAT